MKSSGNAFGKLIVLAAVLVLAIGSSALAQPAAPPPPKEYQVWIRYQISAAGTDRLRAFVDMMRYLDGIGFKRAPGTEDEEAEAEDPNQTRTKGTIASANVRKILLEPHVRAIVLIPSGYALPDENDKPVKVNLTLADGLQPDRQKVLANQIRDKLAALGFQEAIGYDHRGHTRLVGTLPVGRLELLLKDLRWQPAGWLAPDVPLAKLPSPLKNVLPIPIAEVIAEEAPAVKEPAPAPAPAPAKGQDYLQKIAPDLRALAAQEGVASPERMEVILSRTPSADDSSWRRILSQGGVAGPQIEGRLGPLVTIFASPTLAPLLAQLDAVSTVRLPRPAQVQMQPLRNTGPGSVDALRESGLARLHTLGHRSKGVRLAIVDGDFQGYDRLIKEKQLPAGTHYVDLTVERNPKLQPDPFPSEAGTIGHGSQAALAAVLAAPQADLTLIRIDPATPYQLQEVARYINGERYQSEAVAQRQDEFAAETTRLRLRRDELREQRQKVLGNFSEEPEVKEARAAYLKNEAELTEDEKAHDLRVQRFIQVEQQLQNLKGIDIISSSLVWNDGYPLGGSSPLSRFFDERPFRAALWFQSAGNTRGQTWSGLFRDADNNGVMEFAPATAPLRLGRWTHELNFLAWQPFGKDRSVDLPEKAKLHLSIQWREVHEPTLFSDREDLYRQPLANLRLVVLRQRDPSGQKTSTDDFEVVARSEGLPQRLDNQPSSATYEQDLDFLVPSAGRYALRIEGIVPPGTRPPSVPSLPAVEMGWELWPRLFVDFVDPTSRKAGRPIFLDYTTDPGTLGVPGDARSLITVGAATLAGATQPYSTTGSPAREDLLTKPNLLAFDSVRVVPEDTPAAYGADLAAPFAAGAAATMRSAGIVRPDFLQAVQSHPGKVLKVPEGQGSRY